MKNITDFDARRTQCIVADTMCVGDRCEHWEYAPMSSKGSCTVNDKKTTSNCCSSSRGSAWGRSRVIIVNGQVVDDGW